MRRQAGFTLIEILVATVVLAIMSIAAYAGLHAVVKVREHTQQDMRHFKHLQMAMVTLDRDLEQAIARPIRHASGDLSPGMIGGDKDVPELAFTRDGQPNPLQLPRSGLQRIAYGIKNDNLVRYFYLVLDRTVEQDPKQQIILKGVTALHLRFMDQFGKWHTAWPPLNAQSSQYNDIDPIAVDIILDTKRWGKIERVIGIAP
ncbi:MAG TPA: type II secretion system minor pseudopilin GspJ [Gammaproteobacteria bacterium]|nr:type II secretion system minor pseudopilin GspJ [Gammaproteobacteria bacterium]